jgi:hypothetical protein
MTDQHPIAPPPHLLKKFSAQAQAEANKRNGTGYLKTVATLCIEWFVNSQSTSNDRQIRSSEITPPPELVEQWEEQFLERPTINGCFIQSYIATQAAQWGADQELEACCEWLAKYRKPILGDDLRYVRRPQPPNLKEQALALLSQHNDGWAPSAKEWDTIRRALEALDD